MTGEGRRVRWRGGDTIPEGKRSEEGRPELAGECADLQTQEGPIPESEGEGRVTN